MPTSRHAAISMLDHALRERVPPENLEVRQFAKSQINPEEERFIRAMVLMTLRHLGQIDAMIDMTLEKPLPKGKHWVKCAIRIGMAQSTLMRVPAHASVHATVQAIKNSKFRGLASLANFVLRTHSDNVPALPHPLHNMPPWVRDRWQEAYGAEEVQAIARIAEQQPGVDVHYIRPASIPEQARPLLPEHYRMPAGTDITALDGYENGAFFVQDVAASLPVRMLGDIKGKKVLEIGASPGGKTAQLCSYGADVTALDKSEKRVGILFANLERLKIYPGIIVADMFDFDPHETYDVVVIDAPCTATGTWRRHPEVIHLLEEKEIAELAQLQRTMILRAWRWVKPGGRLLYCVCSLEPEEGEAHVHAFLEGEPTARIGSIAHAEHMPEDAITPQGYLRTHPGMRYEDGGMDGFFAVIFEKMA